MNLPTDRQAKQTAQHAEWHCDKNMKDHSAKQAAVFIKTKNDAGSFLKTEDYK